MFVLSICVFKWLLSYVCVCVVLYIAKNYEAKTDVFFGYPFLLQYVYNMYALNMIMIVYKYVTIV